MGWLVSFKIALSPSSINHSCSRLPYDAFNKGLTVSTLNGYRSAISSTVTCFDDISLGNHPVMIKLFKGFSNIRPALYKEPKKWSIDSVLTTICSWRDNTVLELNYLTWKLSMLMALASGSRCGDLASLDSKFMVWLPQGVRFLLQKHKKNRRSSFYPGKIDIPSNPDNMKLCPCACLRVYLARTKVLRESEYENAFKIFVKINIKLKVNMKIKVNWN